VAQAEECLFAAQFAAAILRKQRRLSAGTIESRFSRRELGSQKVSKGYLFLRGKKVQVWVGRWLEDVIGPDNKIVRVHKSEVIGTKADFTKRLAQRELDIRLSRINSLSYQPQKVIPFADLAERWKRNIMSNYKRARSPA